MAEKPRGSLDRGLLGRAIVYRVMAERGPRRDDFRLGRQGVSIIGGVKYVGSNWHPSVFEFAGRVVTRLPDGTFDLELLVPGQRPLMEATRRYVNGALFGTGPGSFQLAKSRPPGFPAIYRASAEDIEEADRDGEKTFSCSFHPSIVAFTAVGGLLRDNGMADLELVIPGVPGRWGMNEVSHSWVCNVPEGDGPGRFQFV